MDLYEDRQCILGVYEKTAPAVLVGLAEFYDFKASGKTISIGYRFLSRFWGKSIGSYSPNPAFTVNEGDLSIDVWKANLVMEDANYILDSFEVEDFILQHCQK